MKKYHGEIGKFEKFNGKIRKILKYDGKIGIEKYNGKNGQNLKNQIEKQVAKLENLKDYDGNYDD